MVLNLFNHKDTQSTYRKLASEVISLYGVPIKYLPKELSSSSEFGNDVNGTSSFGDNIGEKEHGGFDSLYGEDTLIAFRKAIPMKAILENYDFYGGVHNVFNKMGFSMQDEITLTFEIETFRNLMKRYNIDMQRPMEGDLLAFGLTTSKNDKYQLFEVNYVNESFSYFSFGQLTVYKVHCTLFKYSMETIETGDEKIDHINNIDPVKESGDNQNIDKKSERLQNWNPLDPFKDIFDD